MATLALITSPAASIPGVMCVVIPTTRNYRVIGLTLRHAEWVDAVCAEVVPRLSKVLAVPEMIEGGPPHVVVATNFWSTARDALPRMGIRVNAFVNIMPGARGLSGPVYDREVGRLYLLDHLRDQLPIIHLELPEKTIDTHPHVVSLRELDAALRVVQARPRLIDEESASPGLDREDVLTLCLGLAVQHALRSGGDSWGTMYDVNVSPNVTPRRPAYGYRR